MDEKDTDYHIDEDLEHLFHSDLQNLELGHEDTNHDDVIGDHLPEWLVGVIIVIVMLIVAFFVMIITSLIKNIKKNRSSTYIGTGSSPACDDLECGKLGHSDKSGMKMTSFTSVPDTINDSCASSQSVLDSSDHDRLTSGSANGGSGVQGCRNPLFVDDELESSDNNSDKNEVKTGNAESKDKKRVCSKSNINIPSTSSGFSGDDSHDHGRSKGVTHKYKSSNSKKTGISTKTEVNESEKFSENEGDARKRIFASKTKCGNQSSNKKEKIKGISSNDSSISREEETGNNSDGTGDVTKLEKGVKHVIDIPSETSFKDKDTSGCCEDSGVELGSTDSHLKEETAGSSESDDLGSDKLAGVSRDITMKCTSGHEADVRHPEDTNVSPSLSLTFKDGNLSSSDIIKESSFHNIVCSQSSCVGCGAELSAPEVTEEKQDAGHIHYASVNGCAELSQLQIGVLESMTDTKTTPYTELNLNSALTAIYDLEEDTISQESSCSDRNSSNEVDKIMLSDNVSCNNETAVATSRPTRQEDETTTESLNRDECEDSDKLLSTNL